MELKTLANVFSNLLVSLSKYLNRDIENFRSNVQNFLQCYPLIFSPNWEPLTTQSSSSSEEIINSRDEMGINFSEVNLVMSRLGMEQYCLGDKLDGYYYYKGLDAEDMEELFEEEEPSLEEIRETFEVFDVNRDGFIDAADLQSIVGRLGFREGSDLEKCRKMIQGFDTNGDGKLDFQEFLKFMEKCLC